MSVFYNMALAETGSTQMQGVEGFDLTFVDGAGMAVGLWFSGISYGVLVMQLALYIRSNAKDPVLLKLAIGILFLCDTVANCLLMAASFRQLVRVAPGSPESYVPSLTFVLITFFTPVIILGVNCFLTWRYQRLTKRKWLCYIIYACSVAKFIMHMYCNSLNIKLRNFDTSNMEKFISDFQMAGNLAKVALIIEVVLVCVIWALLLTELASYLRQEIMGTKRVVIRLMFITLESGTAATAVAVTSLVYYLVKPASSNLIIIRIHVAHVYFMGMLFTLIMRGSGSEVMRGDSASRPTGGPFGGSDSLHLSHIRSTQQPRYQHKVIHVSQDVETVMDKREEAEGVFKIAEDDSNHGSRHSTSERELGPVRQV